LQRRAFRVSAAHGHISLVKDPVLENIIAAIVSRQKELTMKISANLVFKLLLHLVSQIAISPYPALL